MSPRVFENFNYQFVNNNINNPTKIDLYFGTLGTWLVGALFGAVLATSSRIGSLPKLSVQDEWVATSLAFSALVFCSFKDEITRSIQYWIGSLWLCFISTNNGKKIKNIFS